MRTESGTTEAFGRPRRRDAGSAKRLNLLAEAPLLCHNFRFRFARERGSGID
jgi:hypothetical protein